MESPRTLQKALIHFQDYDNCREFMTDLRWPDGVVRCPRCDSDHVAYLEKARVWKCYGKHDHAKFSLKTGTLFEDSPLGLDKWLAVVWMAVNCKNGISSWEIHRAFGVTQKTAWFMLHRVRLALQGNKGGKLSGNIEADESFIGGKARNMHAHKRARQIHGRGPDGKTIVAAVLERHGEVRVTVLDDRRKKAIQSHVREHVEAGANLYTDELKSYEGLDEFTHQVINHAEEYVNGKIHTNGCENFWSLLKRGLKGTYVSVEPFHLFRYLDEQAFRYNNRKEMDDFDRFKLAVSQIVGKRLTYKELTGKEAETASQEAF